MGCKGAVFPGCLRLKSENHLKTEKTVPFAKPAKGYGTHWDNGRRDCQHSAELSAYASKSREPSGRMRHPPLRSSESKAKGCATRQTLGAPQDHDRGVLRRISEYRSASVCCPRAFSALTRAESTFHFWTRSFLSCCKHHSSSCVARASCPWKW